MTSAPKVGPSRPPYGILCLGLKKWSDSTLFPHRSDEKPENRGGGGFWWGPDLCHHSPFCVHRRFTLHLPMVSTPGTHRFRPKWSLLHAKWSQTGTFRSKRPLSVLSGPDRRFVHFTMEAFQTVGFLGNWRKGPFLVISAKSGHNR